MVSLQIALNGDRRHIAAPRSPDAIGRDTLAVAEAGARSVHVHAYDDAGTETLSASACGAVLRAIRAYSPDTSVSLTTSSDIISDPIERLKAVQGWSDLPDFVTANQGEDGITELCEYLLSRGVGIEAGLLSPNDARSLVKSPLRDQFRRIMIEPLSSDHEVALRDAANMEAILADAGVTIPQVHHGYDGSCWVVNERALMRGHGIRTGLEDVILLPDGRPARSNSEMVEAAKKLIADVKSRH